MHVPESFRHTWSSPALTESNLQRNRVSFWKFHRPDRVGSPFSTPDPLHSTFGQKLMNAAMIITKPHLDYSSSPKKQRPARSIALIILIVTIVVLLFQNHQKTLPPSLYLKPCGHVVLVTAARHGSTWFVACAEGCSSQGKTQFPVSNGRTELWVQHNSKVDVVQNISPESAVDYVRRNMSLKVMPITAKREEDLKRFFWLLDDSIPVFMLRRNLKDSYLSFEEAKETRVWTRNKSNPEDRGSDRKLAEDNNFNGYEKSKISYFEKMSKFMREAGVVWDEIDYEEAALSKTIVAEKQGCYITNCNYL